MLTKSNPKQNQPKVTEAQIQAAFGDVSRYEDFLLDDVGIVVSNKSNNSSTAAKQWGVIGLSDGSYVTYLYGKQSAVSKYRLAGDGHKILTTSGRFLPCKTPVTFSRHRNNPKWAFKVVAWDPQAFEDLLGGQEIYRLVECSPIFGTLYRAGRSQPRNLRTVWEGSNLDSLRSKFPRETWPVRIHGSKPIHFEKREEGAWKLCSDPR